MVNRTTERSDKFTPLERQLLESVRRNPRESIFLSARELAKVNHVSLSTVVRFVRQLGYANYREFSRDMREQIDIRMTLPDRVAIQNGGASLHERIEKEISDEIENLRNLNSHLDLELLGKLAERIWKAPQVYAVGARMSLSTSIYFSWALSRIRSGVINLDGSNHNSLDSIALSAKDTLIVVFTVMRYPNDLLKLANQVHQQGKELIIVADSKKCPLFQFTDHYLSVPCQHFPIVGSPSALGCVVNCMIYAMILSHGEEVREHQNLLEKFYLENDTFFSPSERSRIIDDI